MDIFPAIDLLGGRAVRLLKGDYGRATEYSADPEAVARTFRENGAGYLHVVDLDGARAGGPVHLPLISSIVASSGLKVEVGGGIRSADTAAQLLDAGAWRVILGTAAVEQPGLAEDLAARYGDRIAVGLDARDGRVAVRGWLKDTELSIGDMCEKVLSWGITGVIVTDISRDGAMKGPNMGMYADLVKTYPQLRVTASGGVRGHGDLLALRDSGVSAAIVGRAYYDGAVDIKRAVEECR